MLEQTSLLLDAAVVENAFADELSKAVNAATCRQRLERREKMVSMVSLQ